MHKNWFHAVLSPTNAVSVSLAVAARNRVISTAAQTAQSLRELHAQSHFFSLCSPCLRGKPSFAFVFTPTSLTPAELHDPGGTAATAATFSLVPAESLQSQLQ